MQRILAALALVLLPNIAAAECACTCIRGKSVPICQPQAMVEPICQEICVDKLEQTLGTASVGGGGGIAGGGGGAPGALGAGAAGIDPATLRSLLGR